MPPAILRGGHKGSIDHQGQLPRAMKGDEPLAEATLCTLRAAETAHGTSPVAVPPPSPPATDISLTGPHVWGSPSVMGSR